MSNECRSLPTFELASTISCYSEALGNMITSLNNAHLSAPSECDVHLVKSYGQDILTEVDLHVGYGAWIKVVTPFVYGIDHINHGIAQVRERLETLLASLDATLLERAAMEDAVQAIIADSRCSLREVRLGSIDLTGNSLPARFEVRIDGEVDEMLRPLCISYRLDSLEELTPQLLDLREFQARVAPLRDRALALGAVGYVDALALALVDSVPDGRQAVLRKMARENEWTWNMLSGGRGYSLDLRWRDGVVGLYESPSMAAALKHDRPEDHVPEQDPPIPLSEAGDYMDLPRLHGFRITLTPGPQGDLSVKLDSQPIPFTADGVVLTA